MYMINSDAGHALVPWWSFLLKSNCSDVSLQCVLSKVMLCVVLLTSMNSWPRVCAGRGREEWVNRADFRLAEVSPHGAFVHRVHGRTLRAVENTGKLVKLRHAADHPARENIATEVMNSKNTVTGTYSCADFMCVCCTCSALVHVCQWAAAGRWTEIFSSCTSSEESSKHK